MNSTIKHYTLNNGLRIPCIGFGTWKAAEGDNAEVITTAIKAGYRYFDTASFYQTETYIGEAIAASNIKREEFFLASKMWKDQMGGEEARKAFKHTTEALRTDYLDLYLIHWPVPKLDMPDEEWKRIDLETWQVMEELYHEGRVKAIGLSNFLPHHLENILQHGTVKPAVNQLELHPGYMQSAAVRYCEENDILLQAWSPVARGRILKEPILEKMAERYQVSTATLCLRFLLQKNMVIIPKAATVERMKQNLDIFDFTISKDDMYRLETLPQMGWSGEHPDYERQVTG